MASFASSHSYESPTPPTGPQHLFTTAKLDPRNPDDAALINEELDRLRKYVMDLNLATGSPTRTVVDDLHEINDLQFSSPPTSRKHLNPTTPQSAPSSLMNVSIDTGDVTRTLRGGGGTHGAARVQRRTAIVRVETQARTQQMRERSNLKYYDQDPDLRTSAFRAGKNLSGKTWDKVTNETPFASSVQCVPGTPFPVNDHKSYRGLVEVVTTLDNVGTRGGCPVHLLVDGGEKADYSQVKSKVSHIWSTLPAGQTRRPKTASAATRPSEWLLKGIKEFHNS